MIGKLISVSAGFILIKKRKNNNQFIVKKLDFITQ